MTTVIVLAERLTRSSLSAVIPAVAVTSVRIARSLSDRRDAFTPEGYRSFRSPQRFNPTVRIELLADDDAVARVIDAVSFAYGAGCFSDVEMWTETAALALSA